MSNMKRFKSSLRLGSKVNDQVNDDFQESNRLSLKRSNAKLRKVNRSSVQIEAIREEPKSIPCSEPFRRGHSLRDEDAIQNDQNIPYEASERFDMFHQSLQPDTPPTFTRHDSQQSDSSSSRRKSTSVASFFRRHRKSRPTPPPFDNWTRHDAARAGGRRSMPAPSSSVSVIGSDSLLAAAFLDMSSVASGPARPKRRPLPVDSNPFKEASLAQQNWAGRYVPVPPERDDSRQALSVKRSNVTDKGRAIGDIDWSQHTDGERLQEFIRSFDNDLEDISPVDSGIGSFEEESHPHSKGKGRAIEQDQARAIENDHRLATQLALEYEMNRRKQAWAIYEEEELVARERQEAEDRRQAQEWAIAEEMARLAQEEADRIQAEELAAEEAAEEERREAEEARLAAELSRPRECVCCGDEKSPIDFPAHPPTYTCQHTSQTCSECMQTWISSEHSFKGVQDLKCPECPEILQYDDIQRAASPATFSSYEKLLIRSACGAMDDFSWCLNPAGCDSGQENEASDNYMECAVCKYQQCLKHKCAWHKNETCEEYEYRTSGQKQRDEEEASARLLEEVSKKCPGPGCKWRIQKIDGCDHMTCKRCRWEFCWLCLASHKEIKRVGNTAHENWCKFHSKNLETSWPFNAHA